MMIKIKKRTSGFGIIEVLISGVIIIIVLGALVVLARNAINNAQYVQERAQAVNFAQEGMEIVRQIRDTNYIDGVPGTTWKSINESPPTEFSTAANNAYYVSYSASRFKLISAASPPAITIGGKSFYRTVSFSSISGKSILTIPDNPGAGTANGVVVNVTVSWPDTSTTAHKIELKELLANSRFQF